MRRLFGILVVIMVVGLGGMALWAYVLIPMLEKRELIATSDRYEGVELTVCGDSYTGYYPMKSRRMKRELRSMAERNPDRKGVKVRFVDDEDVTKEGIVDYANRLERFANGEGDGRCDIMFLPIAQYVRLGKKHNYPGPIVWVVSDSQDADGVVVRTDRVQKSGKDLTIQDLNDPNLTWVLTMESPSEDFSLLLVSQFGLDRLRANQDWMVGVGGSGEVLARAKKGEGDVFVGWEPELSQLKALPNMQFLVGSGVGKHLILDVAVVKRSVLYRQTDEVVTLFRAYSRVIDHYSQNPDQLVADLAAHTDLTQAQAQAILDAKSIDWFTLRENAAIGFGLVKRQGGYQEAVYDSLIQWNQMLKTLGVFDRLPLNDNAMDNILHADVVGTLVQGSGGISNEPVAQVRDFRPLSDDEWINGKVLREVGTLSVEPIRFRQASSILTDESKAQIAEYGRKLMNHYGQYYVIIRGRAAPGRNKKLGLEIATERGKAVLSSLQAQFPNIDPDRIRVEGVLRELTLLAGETRLDFQARQMSAEFVLMALDKL